MALAVAAAAVSVGLFAHEAEQVFHDAWQRRHQSYETLTAALVGREYFESVLSIRGRVPESGRLLLIDTRQTSTSGSYFALHYLAPRRLVRLGSWGPRALRRLRRAPHEFEAVLLVEAGRPLKLVPRAELDPEWRRGDR